MATIGISTSKIAKAIQYQRVVEKAGGSPILLRPGSYRSPGDILDGIKGLLLTGGEDIDPVYYNQSSRGATPDRERDAFEMPLIKSALERDVPIFGICRGMEAINVVMGGALVRDVHGHRSADKVESAFHDVYIAPGSRLGAILSGGPIMRVNSRHHQGVNQAKKASGLMASAYVLEGDLIEAIESPDYTWVIGVQWHPERQTENHPKNMNLFHSLVEAANRNGRKIY